jgi:topoisomerase-4 subunit A
MAKLIIELKKDANAELVLNFLLKNTDLQISYSFNMVAIVNHRPKQLGILAIIDAFIAHQKEVVIRRTNFDLEHALARMHIVEGLLKAIDVLDEVIKTIRASKNKADSIENLMKVFDFTEEQATAIVTMQLYRLSNTDITQLLGEKNDLLKMISFLKQILSDEEVLKKQMKNELLSIKKEFATPRITEIRDEVTEIKLDAMDMIPKEKTVVIVTNEGYLKRVSLKSYTTSDGDMALKPGDFIANIYNTNTQNKLLLFTNLGNYLYIPIHTLLESKWKELGKHINNIIMMSQDERVIGSAILEKGKSIVLTTKYGMIKTVLFDDFEVQRYSKPICAIKLKENDELLSASVLENETLLVTKNGYYLRYLSNEIPTIGPKAAGVKAINLKDDYLISSYQLNSDYEYLNILTNNNTVKRIKIEELNVLSRAKKGNMLFKKPKTKEYFLVSAYPSDTRTINLLKCDSEIREIKNADISILDINSTGSLITKNKIDDMKPKAIEQNSIEEKESTKNEEEQLSFADFVNDFKI